MYPPPPVCTSASLQCGICANQCVFPARLCGWSAWMHSHQIKPALAAYDLFAPPRHPRGPLSLHRHLSFYPSFDISAPSVIAEVPLSAEVSLWHKWGVSPKIPAGLHVFPPKGAHYCDSVKTPSDITPKQARFRFKRLVYVNLGIHLRAVQELQLIIKE